MSKYDRLSSSNVDGTVSTSKQGMLIGAVETLPVASESMRGNVVLYIGDNSLYNKGTFYQCDGTQWNAVTQPVVLSPNRVVVTDYSGNLKGSDVTAVELGYVAGAESNLQQQITAVSDAVQSKVDVSAINSVIDTLNTEMKTRASDDEAILAFAKEVDKQASECVTALNNAIQGETVSRINGDANVVNEAVAKTKEYAEAEFATRDAIIDTVKQSVLDLASEADDLNARLDETNANVSENAGRIDDLESLSKKSLGSASIAVSGTNAVKLETVANDGTKAYSEAVAVQDVSLSIDSYTRVLSLSVNGVQSSADLSGTSTASIDSVHVKTAMEFYEAIASTRAVIGRTFAIVNVAVADGFGTHPLFCVLDSVEDESDYRYRYLRGSGTVLDNGHAKLVQMHEIEVGATGQFIIRYIDESEMKLKDSASMFVSASVFYI